ncbi:LysM peptidoglycan-binding domain-containing protein [bacterium]|nr:LysM peptidoglycan-binding domain-containing protein [bacterium]
MDWLTKLKSYFVSESTSKKTKPASTAAKKSTAPIVKGNPNSVKPNEIRMMTDISDNQIQINQERSKYIIETKNPDYKIKQKDSPASIARKFGVELRTLLALNGLDKADTDLSKAIRVGQTLKIPPTRTVKNVKNLNDVAKSMGVSVDFIKKLKSVEDSAKLKANEFHNTPYKDKAGVLTIGIGHVLKDGEPRKLTNEQVCELFAKDLLKMEDNLCVLLGGKKNYDKLPQSMKEALLDMMFNKGSAILEDTPGLLYCLKAGKYEAAINKFTHNKSMATGKEMSGLSKRRLFDISLATGMYKGNIPSSILNTMQQVYNRGIELLRKENPNPQTFANVLAGYNQDVQSYFGNNKIKLITK